MQDSTEQEPPAALSSPGGRYAALQQFVHAEPATLEQEPLGGTPAELSTTAHIIGSSSSAQAVSKQKKYFARCKGAPGAPLSTSGPVMCMTTADEPTLQ
jgi:hypothetical protein